MASLWWFLFSFQGRIGRLAYWGYTIGTIVVLITFFAGAASIAAWADGPSQVPQIPASGTDWVLAITTSVIGLAYLWSYYAVHAKRWHDRDKSGWWSLIGLVPYIGGLWILVECGFLKGTAGTNRFGDDPMRGGLVEVFE